MPRQNLNSRTWRHVLGCGMEHVKSSKHKQFHCLCSSFALLYNKKKKLGAFKRKKKGKLSRANKHLQALLEAEQRKKGIDRSTVISEIQWFQIVSYYMDLLIGTGWKEVPDCYSLNNDLSPSLCFWIGLVWTGALENTRKQPHTWHRSTPQRYLKYKGTKYVAFS